MRERLGNQGSGMRLGIVGLGHIGLPLAKKLAAAGNEIVLFDAKDDVAATACAEIGARMANSASQIASWVDVLFVSVSGHAQEAVFFAAAGVFDGCQSGMLVVDLTTTSVAMSRRLAESAAARGINYLDAPVSVAQRPDIVGTLTIMVGGEVTAFARAKPLLDLIAARVHFVGPSGSGTRLKLINQGIYISYMLAFAEGLTDGEEAGISIETLLAVLAPSSGGSPSIETKYPELRAESHNKFSIENALDYLEWAEAASSRKDQLSVRMTASNMLQIAVGAGAGADDVIVARRRYLRTEGGSGMDQKSENWVTIARSPDIKPGQVIASRVGELEIALYNLDGSFHATDNICTHAFSYLSDGWLEGNVIECPLHGGQFDVCSGKALGGPVTRDLRGYPVRLLGDEIQINVA